MPLPRSLPFPNLWFHKRADRRKEVIDIFKQRIYRNSTDLNSRVCSFPLQFECTPSHHIIFSSSFIKTRDTKYCSHMSSNHLKTPLNLGTRNGSFLAEHRRASAARHCTLPHHTIPPSLRIRHLFGAIPNHSKFPTEPKFPPIRIYLVSVLWGDRTLRGKTSTVKYRFAHDVKDQQSMPNTNEPFPPELKVC